MLAEVKSVYTLMDGACRKVAICCSGLIIVSYILGCGFIDSSNQLRPAFSFETPAISTRVQFHSSTSAKIHIKKRHRASEKYNKTKRASNDIRCGIRSRLQVSG